MTDAALRMFDQSPHPAPFFARTCRIRINKKQPSFDNSSQMEQFGVPLRMGFADYLEGKSKAVNSAPQAKVIFWQKLTRK